MLSNARKYSPVEGKQWSVGGSEEEGEEEGGGGWRRLGLGRCSRCGGGIGATTKVGPGRSGEIPADCDDDRRTVAPPPPPRWSSSIPPIALKEASSSVVDLQKPLFGGTFTG